MLCCSAKHIPEWFATSGHFPGGVDGGLRSRGPDGHLVFNSSPVRALLLPHSHGAYDLLSAVNQPLAPHRPHSAPRASPLRIITIGLTI